MATYGSEDDIESEGEDCGGFSPPLREEESCQKQAALLSLMEKTGYNMLQVNGQRMYGGPPPGWEGPVPPRGCEVFVGKIPRDMYEDELVPLFERAGKIYELRLMMEFSGNNRGYAFVMYTNRDDTQKAIQLFDKNEVRPGKFIGVCLSLNNCRLFIGCIPKDKTKEDIVEEMMTLTDGVVDVIMYHSPTDRSSNRGFAFVEYDTHKAAAMARRTLIAGNRQLWGQTIQIDWAKPEKDMDETSAQRVRVLYVRNLMLTTTEDTLYEEFSRFQPGCVARVKKLSDYAFIHYRCRDDALVARGLMNGAQIDGVSVDVTLARPTAVREGSAAGKSGNGRGGEALASNGMLLTRGMGDAVDQYSPLRPVPTQPGSPPGTAAREEPDRCVFPLLPGTPLSPTNLHVLKPSQIRSAVSLLDFYCSKNYWSLPEYQLFATPGQEGKRLLLYKVMIQSTHSTYVPDKLCVLLDDAKELAAQTALWNLDLSLLSEASCRSCGIRSPPLAASLSSSSTGMLSCGGRAFASCVPPAVSQTQRVHTNSQSPFY